MDIVSLLFTTKEPKEHKKQLIKKKINIPRKRKGKYSLFRRKKVKQG